MTLMKLGGSIALCLAALLVSATNAVAAPAINEGGVVNAGSFAASTLSNGGIAQGAWFSIFGSGLGPASVVVHPQLPYPTDLSGVTVRVTGGSTSVNAYLWVVSGGQINAIMPSNAPVGDAELTVSYNGETSAPAKLKIVKSTFGAFTPSQNGQGPGWVFNFIDSGNQPANTNKSTARPGQFATVWGTGLGPVPIPDNVEPFPAAGGDVNVLDLKEEANVKVFVGTAQSPQVFYAGRSAQFPALDQITFQVPENAPTGCWVPVTVETDGVPSPSFKMAIDADGKPCADPLNPFTPILTGGGDLGVMLLIRAAGELSLGAAPTAFTWDLFAGNFATQPGGDFAYNFYMSLPPLGACVTAAVPLDILGFLSTGALPDIDLGAEIDGGNGITLRRSSDSAVVEIPKVDNRYVKTTGGGLLPGGPPLFWNAGAFNITSPGGAAVGPVNFNVNFPQSVQWTNANVTEINRSQGFTFTWQGGDPSQVVVVAGVNVGIISKIAAAYYCFGPQQAGQFTVPPVVLNSLFPTGEPGTTLGFAGVGVIPVNDIARFQAQGLEAGVALPAIVDLRTVSYR